MRQDLDSLTTSAGHGRCPPGAIAHGGGASGRTGLLAGLLVCLVGLSSCTSDGASRSEGTDEPVAAATGLEADTAREQAPSEAGAGEDTAAPGGGAEGSVAAATPPAAEGEIVPLEPSTHPLKGQPAPELTMTLLATDEVVGLADWLGRPVLVNFWATWCVPCRVEMPWFQTAYERHAADGLEVLSVDAGEHVPPSMAAATIERYVEAMGLTFPVLYGENTYDVQKTWTVEGLPVTFLIDAQGTVVDVRSGGYPNQATFEDHIRRILPGR